MTSKYQLPFLIEAMEPRVLFDASLLSEAIVSSTLPANTYNASKLHGDITMRVTN